MNDRLPSATITVHDSPQEFMGQMAKVAKLSKRFDVQRRSNYETTPELDIIDFIPEFRVLQKGLIGQLIYTPSYKQKVAIEVRASQWTSEPLTYELYVTTLHEIFDDLLSQFNKDFKHKYRLSIESRAALEPKLPPNAHRAFQNFVTLANKGSLHPLDWNRFYRFVYACRATRVNPTHDDLIRLLEKESFDAEYAKQIASIFGYLMDFARMR
jgi:hypothetical protein